jgi:flagellar basal-body rod modification protein FlgD
MSEVVPVRETNPFSTASSAPRRAELGQDAFLQLLITQLKYQDPLSPIEDTEFIAQLAQFSALAELQKLNEHLTKSATEQSLAYAAALIGKEVEGVTVSGASVRGVVDKVSLVDGEISLHIGSEILRLASVSTIAAGGGKDAAS